MSRILTTDIVIFGGGISGLWLLNRLHQQGYDVILFDKAGLGGGQSLASQGIIHGGLKYALNGALSPASSAIADMPEHWRRCLRGEGDISLSGLPLLAPHYFMWSSGGIRSRLKSFLGSKALRGRIDALAPERYPEFFKGKSISGTLYQLTDFVVDTPALIARLAASFKHRIFRINAEHLFATMTPDGQIDHVRLEGTAAPVHIRAQRYVLTAGEGNAGLLSQLGQQQPQMQTRPLHMLAVRLPHPYPAFVHCIGDSFGMTPRLTITSHPDGQGTWIWYVGGEIAESGVQRSPEAQQEEGRRQLGAMFPWVDFTKARWSSFHINRAEPRLPNLQRPDSAFLHASGQLLTAWPTKLTLAPHLADSVYTSLQQQQIQPQAPTQPSDAAKELANFLEYPDIAVAPWMEMFP
jgi:glycine/D-amino acid oxidase-like deaminating enzyme